MIFFSNRPLAETAVWLTAFLKYMYIVHTCILICKSVPWGFKYMARYIHVTSFVQNRQWNHRNKVDEIFKMDKRNVVFCTSRDTIKLYSCTHAQVNYRLYTWPLISFCTETLLLSCNKACMYCFGRMGKRHFALHQPQPFLPHIWETQYNLEVRVL